MQNVTKISFSACALMLLSLTHAFAAPNTGQDATQPLTRFDIRYQHDSLPFDSYHNNFNKNDADTIVFRADAPVSLGESGVMYVRMDVPFLSSSSSTPGESGNFDLGSIYAQAIYISSKDLRIAGKYAWGLGMSANLGSATNGRQKETWAPTFGMSIPIHPFGSEHEGSAIIPLIKYLTAPEEKLRQGTLNFDEISELSFRPTINFTLPWEYFEVFTLWGENEWRYNFEDGKYTQKESGDYFIPYDVTVGKMLANHSVIMSMTASGPLFYSDEYKVFDHRLMFRLGFFFGQ
ncbi:hypothetical protein [Vibrio sp. YIC-376]|uniref:hypothetical protein n=1 Tax=Vibrio sp. YIC-376 TaxID=3136162 RepID=UPI00402A6E48